MKKIFTLLMLAVVAVSAMAQTDAELGKKWYDTERYDKALPYLVRAVKAGDADSKARLATMIFTMQVPEYSLDRDAAMTMLDEAIEAGSVLAMERKAFCTLIMGEDSKPARENALELYRKASDAGNTDATFNLYKVYRDGLTANAHRDTVVVADEAKAKEYLDKALEQGGMEGKAYVGYYMLTGAHGYGHDEEVGMVLLEEAFDMDKVNFAGNCVEPCKALISIMRAKGKIGKAAEAETLLKRFHPGEF